MVVYDAHAADLVASIPDMLARINTLQRNVVPHIEMRVGEHGVQLGTIRRMLGDEQAFSLKARRALAPDREMGNAADDDFYGLQSLEEIERPETSVISPVVKRRVDDIEQRLSNNESDMPLSPQSMTCESGYANGDNGTFRDRVRSLEAHMAEMRADMNKHYVTYAKLASHLPVAIIDRIQIFEKYQDDARTQLIALESKQTHEQPGQVHKFRTSATSTTK